MPRTSNLGLGVNWQPGLQDGFVNERGSDMIHEVAIACPKCRTSDVHANMIQDGRAQTRSPNCPNCGGDGWLFRDPTPVRGLAVSIRQQRNILDAGVAQPGDMQFSPGPGEAGGCGSTRRVGNGDKFTATWDQPLDDGQTIVRGAAHMDENLRLEFNVNPDEDRLWYEPGSALWCEDEDGVVYKPGDFELGPGRVIHWVGNRPQIGTKYTLKYTAYFEWIVWAPPQERVDHANLDLGPLIFLRRRHIAFINTSPLIVESDRRPLSARTTC